MRQQHKETDIGKNTHKKNENSFQQSLLFEKQGYNIRIDTRRVSPERPSPTLSCD